MGGGKSDSGSVARSIRRGAKVAEDVFGYSVAADDSSVDIPRHSAPLESQS